MENETEEFSEKEFPLALLKELGVKPLQTCRFRDGFGLLCEAEKEGVKVPLSLYPPRYIKDPNYFWLGVHAHPEYVAELPKTRLLIPKDTTRFTPEKYEELLAEGVKYWQTARQERTEENVQNDLREGDAGNR
jgi:hypothetical protein